MNWPKSLGEPGPAWTMVAQLVERLERAEAELAALKVLRPCKAENPHKLVPSRCPDCGQELTPADCMDVMWETYTDGILYGQQHPEWTVADRRNEQAHCCANCGSCTPAGLCLHPEALNSVQNQCPMQSNFCCRYWNERNRK